MDNTRESLTHDWEEVLLTPHFETSAMRAARWERERRLVGDVMCWGKPRWYERHYERDHVEPLGAYGLSREMRLWAGRLQSKKVKAKKGGMKEVKQQWAARNYQAWLMRKHGAYYRVIAESLQVTLDRARQIVAKQDRIQRQKWRYPSDDRIIRGESPIHDEPWTE